MNPRQNQRDQMNNTDPNHLRNDSSSENTARNSAAEQGPQYGNGFTMFPPNETRRNNWRESAQREVESLETLREAQRSAPVHMDPARLGGNRTMAEVREQQNRDQRNIKLQKQMKQGDEKRRKKEEEERQLQEIKDIHRKKTEQQEKRKKQEEDKKRELYAEKQRSAYDRMQQQMPSRSASRNMNEAAANTSDAPKVKQEEQQREHKRINAAFLDKIDHKIKTERGESSSPEAICSGRSAGDGVTNTEYEGALMTLIVNFPHYEEDFLYDILSQCNGDYDQAYALLLC